MGRYLYDEIEREEYPAGTRYTCAGEEAYNLFILLRIIGEKGWELIGEVEGMLLVKKKDE